MSKKRSRFTAPTTRRVELSEGDWIEIKDGLSYGEQKRLSSASVKTSMTTAGAAPEMTVDFEQYALLRISLWVVDWSFEDQNGNRVRVTMEAIAALTQETGDEIDEALTEHIEAIEAEKNPTPPEEETTG